MAEGFDRGRFESQLRTRLLGRTLVVRDRTGSTNDDAWDALAAGYGEGFVVIASEQSAGRGRLGRRWHMAPGMSLALSLVLVRGCDAAALAVTPLAAGVALWRALSDLGVTAELKWPNDLLLGGRKLAGLLVESRMRAPAGGDDRAVVVGVGVNVAQTRDDFPEELRDIATSLRVHGHDVRREDLAAHFLDRLEPLWTGLEAEGPRGIVEAWRAASTMWGRAVSVADGRSVVHGIARGLDDEGRLIVDTGEGARVIVTGDVAMAGEAS